MKIQRTPIILLTIAALLGGAVFFYEAYQSTKQEDGRSANQKLFPFEESDIQAFTMKTPQQTVSFAKVAASETPSPKPTAASPSPTPQIWQMTAPTKGPASDGTVAFLLNLLGTGTAEKTLTIPTARLAEFGFDQPQATIDITLKNQKTHRLVLGNPDFNRSFLYAQIDPVTNPKPEHTIHLVSLDFENAINRPLSEWKQSPADKPTQLPNPPVTPSKP